MKRTSPSRAALWAILFSVTLSPSLFGQEVRIGYVNVMDDAPVMVAYEAGFYEELGLEAELIMFSSGTDLIKGIVNGNLDIGVLGFTNALSWASRGADLRIIGGAQRGYHSLLVREDLGIHNVADLAGRSLASQKQGSTADVILSNIILPGAGIEKQEIGMRYTSPALAVQSLSAGAVDAALLFEPYARIAMYTSEVREIYEIGEHWPFPCMVVITDGQSWTDRRGILEKVLEAQKRAIELLQDHPERAAALIRSYFIQSETLETPSGPVPSDRIIEEAIRANTFSWELTDLDIQRIREIGEIMLGENLLAEAVDIDSILDLQWQRNQE